MERDQALLDGWYGGDALPVVASRLEVSERVARSRLEAFRDQGLAVPLRGPGPVGRGVRWPEGPPGPAPKLTASERPPAAPPHPAVEILDPLERWTRELAGLVERVGNVERLSIAIAARNMPDGLNPSTYARSHSSTLGVVAYHFRQLAADGLLEEVRSERRRGALATFYALAPAGHAIVADLEELRSAAAR